MEIELNHNNTLSEGEYYHNQIIGLQVITTNGEHLGAIIDILPGTSNDNYIVRSLTE